MVVAEQAEPVGKSLACWYGRMMRGHHLIIPVAAKRVIERRIPLFRGTSVSRVERTRSQRGSLGRWFDCSKRCQVRLVSESALDSCSCFSCICCIVDQLLRSLT